MLFPRIVFNGAALFLLFGLVSLKAATSPALTRITPVIYNNAILKSFLAEYLTLTEAQMVQADLAFAEARAKLFPLTAKMNRLQEKLESSLAKGSSAAQWRPLIPLIANTQSQMLELECTALHRFQKILDGDQKYKLSRVNNLSMSTNPEGQPVLAYSVEQ